MEPVAIFDLPNKSWFMPTFHISRSLTTGVQHGCKTANLRSGLFRMPICRSLEEQNSNQRMILGYEDYGDLSVKAVPVVVADRAVTFLGYLQ